jgi:hypothetical protein
LPNVGKVKLSGSCGAVQTISYSHFSCEENFEDFKLLVIYSHGNASDLADVFFFGERIAYLYDVDFLGYDYSGYGLGRK